jgi:hypothetical protein
MARKPSKKTTKRSNKKTSVKNEQTKPASRAEKALLNIRNNIDKQEKNLLIARDNLRKKRRDAAKKSTQSAGLLVAKAQSRVEVNMLKLHNMSKDLIAIRAQVKTESLLKNIKDIEERAVEKLELYEIALLQTAEKDLGIAVEKFKSRWQKKRALIDERRLKARKRKNRSKQKVVEKRAHTEIRAVKRKADKSLNKPVKVPKSPGRPRKDSDPELLPETGRTSARSTTVKAKTVTATRGQPKKKVTNGRSVTGTHKKRGRPPGKAKPRASTAGAKTRRPAVKKPSVKGKSSGAKS